MKSVLKRYFLPAFISILSSTSFAQNVSIIGKGWASNSVNTTIFRKNSLVSYRDTQFAAYYNADKFVVLAKRKLGTDSWTVTQTRFKGKAEDAHNVISIMVDGEGYLHLTWDHHNNKLHYSKSIRPCSFEMTDEMPMIGKEERELSYPEFYKLPDGNILFFYRDGGSGRGNLVINKYDTRKKSWTRLQDNLISGERKRNAYWQACVDGKGVIHVSWVWRESPDVASNHDMCYARSKDGGLIWEKSDGAEYVLPITASTAEHACDIPQKSELINQTSISCDAKGNPFIVSYWKDQGTQVPQYHLIYRNGKKWQNFALDFRKAPFSLSGVGTKRIPISRPQVMVKGKGEKSSVFMLFRDEERGSKPSMLYIPKLKNRKWTIQDLSQENLGSWEPTYDTELWKDKKILNLFVQHTEQTDAEGISNIEAQDVKVIQPSPPTP